LQESAEEEIRVGAGMRATIEGKALAAAVKLATAATDEKNSVYSTLLLKAGDDAVEIAGASWARRTAVRVPAEVVTAGEIAVNAKDFSSIVAGIKGGDVVSLADRPEKKFQLLVKAGDFMARLRGLEPYVLPGETWPSAGITVEAAVLGVMLRVCRHAVATTPMVWALMGVSLAMGKDGLYAAASDNRRLVEARAPKLVRSGDFPSIILPADFADEIADLCEKLGDLPIRISALSQRVWIEAGAIRISSQLLDARFPDYQRIVDRCAGCGFDAALLRRDCLRAIERLGGIVPDSNRRADLTVRMTPDGATRRLNLSVSADGQSAEDAVGGLTILASGGAARAVSCLWGNLHSALRALTSQQFRLFLPPDPSAPVGLFQSDPPVSMWLSPVAR